MIAQIIGFIIKSSEDINIFLLVMETYFLIKISNDRRHRFN